MTQIFVFQTKTNNGEGLSAMSRAQYICGLQLHVPIENIQNQDILSYNTIVDLSSSPVVLLHRTRFAEPRFITNGYHPRSNRRRHAHHFSCFVTVLDRLLCRRRK